MISLLEMRVLDANLEYFGVSIEELMETAGRGVADVLLERMEAKGRRVVFFCGPGNNGGDGFVAARLLDKQSKVTVALARPADQISRGPAKENFLRLPRGVDIRERPADYRSLAREVDILVDGLLGTGIQGELREPYRSIVEAMNSSGKPILSIDLPSGMGSDVVVHPRMTVALHAVKEGMDEESCGEIVAVDIGITKEQERLVGPGEFLYYPRPGLEAHKGESGRVLVVGGGPFTGAPALVGLGAYRMGSDVVHVATPAIAHPVVASFSPSLIVHPLPGTVLDQEDVARVLRLAEGKQALVIGPGLGNHSDTLAAVREILRGLKIPVVIDADGIAAVAEDLSCVDEMEGVITPHRTEFFKLSEVELSKDLEERIEQVRAFAAEVSLTVLLKGRYDIISDGRRVKVNQTGNPAMAVGGTGDVLAGLVGGLMGKGMKPFDAARLAAFTNGYAGDIAFREFSYGMIATDLLEKIPAVLIEFL